MKKMIKNLKQSVRQAICDDIIDLCEDNEYMIRAIKGYFGIKVGSLEDTDGEVIEE